MTLVSDDTCRKLSSDESFRVMKVKEVEIAKGVMAGDVSPVAMFMIVMVGRSCVACVAGNGPTVRSRNPVAIGRRTACPVDLVLFFFFLTIYTLIYL